MKTEPRTLFTMLAVPVAIALGLHFGALDALGIVPSPPVTYALGDLNGQNGWDGGIVGGNPVPFTNNNPGSDVVVNTIAFSGTQSWRYSGSYNSPGPGAVHPGCRHRRCVERDRGREPDHSGRQQIRGLVRVQGSRAGRWIEDQRVRGQLRPGRPYRCKPLPAE